MRHQGRHDVLISTLGGFLGLGLGLGLRANTNTNTDAFVAGAAGFAACGNFVLRLLYGAFKRCHTYCPDCL